MALTAETVEGFVATVLANNYDESTSSPQFHKELWQEACSDAQYVAIAAPRNHAKTTAGTMAYGMAMLLFRESRYLVIVSDTEGQAAMFLQNIAHELRDNELIADLFQLSKNEKGLVQFDKDTETDIIVRFQDGHRFRIVAKGAEQKLRGMNWLNQRPDLVICDDLENDELVMNKERRMKLLRWFNSSLLHILSKTGKFRVWGTILHMDSLLENLMPVESNKTCVEEHLRVRDPYQRGLWRSTKYRAHNSDFSELLWPERFNADYFKAKREEAFRNGIPDSYSQEYLNHPIDESVAYFKRSDFLPEKPEYKELNLQYYITVDLAISETETSDYSVFLVAGIDEQRRIHIVNVYRERLDGREIVDLLLRLHTIYRPEAIGIEEMQVSKAIGPFLREEMIKQDQFLTLVKLKHGGKDKITRGRSIQARMRAKTVFFDQEADWYNTFQDECIRFPRSKHDDQVDAFAYLGMLLDKMTEAPTNAELMQEEYEEEVRESQWNDSGRSRITGY